MHMAATPHKVSATGGAGSGSSTIVDHAPQSGQRPTQRGDCAPQAVQA